MTVSAFGVEDNRISKALGDAQKSKQAKTRQKAGLGTAGAGYLLASRTKDVSPGAADLLTRSPKKIGEKEHAARAAKKIKIMNRAGGRGGAALVGGGLALAGEGFVNDLRHRRVLDSAKKKTFGKAGPVGKAFGLPGLSELGSKVASSSLGQSATALGSKVATSPLVKPAVNPVRNAGLRLAQLSTPKKVALGVGAGAAAGALGAQQVNKAYDPERQRHKRADLAEGVTAGGAVVAGHQAAVLGSKAKRAKLNSQAHTNLAGRNRFDTEMKLHDMGQAKGTPVTRQNMTAAAAKLRRASGHDEEAARIAGVARKLTHGSRGAAAGAAALGATALGIHRSDRRGSGRSGYGY